MVLEQLSVAVVFYIFNVFELYSLRKKIVCAITGIYSCFYRKKIVTESVCINEVSLVVTY
jgi:hypothetical protein